MVSSWHNKPLCPGNGDKNPPKTVCGCLQGGVVENGRARNPLTLCGVPALVHVRVWVHIPGDPQGVQPRNATTTTTWQSHYWSYTYFAQSYRSFHFPFAHRSFRNTQKIYRISIMTVRENAFVEADRQGLGSVGKFPFPTGLALPSGKLPTFCHFDALNSVNPSRTSDNKGWQCGAVVAKCQWNRSRPKRPKNPRQFGKCPESREQTAGNKHILIEPKMASQPPQKHILTVINIFF